MHPKPKEFYGCSSSMRNRQLESGFLTNSSIKTSHDFRSSKEAKTASVGRKRASQSSDDDPNTILVGINVLDCLSLGSDYRKKCKCKEQIFSPC